MPEVTIRIPDTHPAFAGHFPGRPVLPGVSLLAEVVELALRDPETARTLGPSPRLAVAKFLAPVRPGTELDVRVHVGGGRLHFECRRGGRLAASGSFEPADAAEQTR